MSLKLNIYDKETKKVINTYEADSADIMFGTIEDIIGIIDIDKISDKMTWAKLILVSIKNLRPLLKDVFIGITDEELKNTKVKELVPLFKEIFDFMWDEILGLGGNGSKN